MEMEVDESVPSSENNQNQNSALNLNNRNQKTNLLVWFFFGAKGSKRTSLENIDLNLNLKGLKEVLAKDPLFAALSDSPDKIDLVHNGKVLKNDDESLINLGITSNKKVLTVLKKIERKTKFEACGGGMSNEEASQVGMALRTAFLSSSFPKTMERISSWEILENMYIAAPGLRDDPIGNAIIQDVTMIFNLSDADSIKKLSEKRPWVVEAFNFIAAAAHAEKEKNPSGASAERTLRQLFRMPMLDTGDGSSDEDMDDDDEREGGEFRPITREQLSRALGTMNPLFGTPPSSAAGRQRPTNSIPPPINPLAFSEALRSAYERITPTASGTSLNSTTSTPSMTNPFLPNFSNINPLNLNTPSNTNPFAALTQNLTPSSTVVSAPPGSSDSQITPESVVRALRNAINQLPADQRSEQYNNFMQLATKLKNTESNASQSQGQASDSQQSTSISTANASSSSSGPSGRNNSLAVQYKEQLIKMKEMGIFDENLSIMALQVSQGDVNTAVDLVLSGWTGEGFEPIEEDP